MSDPTLTMNFVSFSGVVTAISAGQDFSCAALTSGAVYCWGRNVNWQLGTGDNVNRNTPTAVLGLTSGK